jgi:hypothetical protein
MKFDKLVENILFEAVSNNLRSIGEDIANHINEGLNLRYEHPRWGKNTLQEVYTAYGVPIKRWTRGDYAQYYDPRIIVGLDDKSSERLEYYRKNYNIGFDIIKQKALEIVKSLGELVELSGPHGSLKSQAVKYRGIYILLDDPLEFGLVTKNKLKGVLHKT